VPRHLRIAAHLTGLCWLLEHGGSRAVGNEPLRRWLSGARQIDKPPLPCFRGLLTVAVARDAPDPLAYGKAVERWTRATWEAYSGLHLLAHRWIDEAVALDAK
jgi:hypothetical protein